MAMTPDPIDAGLAAMRAEAAESPRGLRQQVIAQVRAQPRRGRAIPGPDGHELAENDIAATIREAADRVGHVRSGSCRILPHMGPDGTPLPGPVRVELSLAVAQGAAIPRLDASVRARIRETVLEIYGLRLESLTLHVTDLFDD